MEEELDPYVADLQERLGELKIERTYLLDKISALEIELSELAAVAAKLGEAVMNWLKENEL